MNGGEVRAGEAIGDMMRCSGWCGRYIMARSVQTVVVILRHVDLDTRTVSDSRKKVEHILLNQEIPG